MAILKNKAFDKYVPLWVCIRVLYRTINQLLPIIEKNLEKSKYSVLNNVSAKANNLIDCLSTVIYLPSASEADSDDARAVNLGVYKSLIDVLIDITLISDFEIPFNAVSLMNKCADLLETVDNEVSLFVERSINRDV